MMQQALVIVVPGNFLLSAASRSAGTAHHPKPCVALGHFLSKRFEPASSSGATTTSLTPRRAGCCLLRPVGPPLVSPLPVQFPPRHPRARPRLPLTRTCRARGACTCSPTRPLAPGSTQRASPGHRCTNYCTAASTPRGPEFLNECKWEASEHGSVPIVSSTQAGNGCRERV